MGAARAVPATKRVERRDVVCMLAVFDGLILWLVGWFDSDGWMDVLECGSRQGE